MNDTRTLASVPHQAARSAMPIWPTGASRRLYSLAPLRTMITTYRARRRFRCDLERMAKDNPHLIDDIGLTGQQARAEILKPFWQA